MQNRTDEFSDIDIIRKVVSGDVNAFEMLIERHQAHVLSIVRKHVPAMQVDEVAHDVFVRAYKGLAGFSGNKGFEQWLSGIAVRTCYDFWRERYRIKEVPISQLNDAHREWIENVVSDTYEENYEALGRQKQAAEVLETVLNRLSAGDRMALELIYLEGLTYKEAADLLGWSITNIKIRTYRAKKKLYNIILKEKK